jgi:ABC-2 type transport system permease protein
MRAYVILLGAAVRAELQYRANFLIHMIGGICYQGIGLACIWAVLSQFGTIGGWSLREVAFLYAIRLTAHGLWVVPFGQLFSVDEVVRLGEYDRYLVRPANPLVQLITRRIHLTAFGDLLGGVLLLVIASAHAPVRWSPGAVAFLLLAVVGGAMVELSLQLAASAMAFRLLSTLSLKFSIDAVFNDVGSYPLKIFGGAARFGLTFVFPLAFVAYLPSTVLMDRTGELAVPVWLAWGSPMVGGVLLAVAYLFWTWQSRYYKSSGH